MQQFDYNMAMKIGNENILNAFLRAKHIIGTHKNICVAISGGSDSDIVLDMIERVKGDGNNIIYFWTDTGLEYEATKEHIKELEGKYNIKIQRIRAKKPIPLAVKEGGQPFLSKYISEQIDSLQRNNFIWADEPYEILIERYPRAKSALKWWCSKYEPKVKSFKSMFNISTYFWLKEFMIENPPKFRISGKCCYYAKKESSKSFLDANNADLLVRGLRKNEGGVRSIQKSCFTPRPNGYNYYSPIFFFSNSDKEEYEKIFHVTHSRCYTEYGFIRTGCCCCPFSGRALAHELNTVEIYEPNLFVAVNTVFHQSYQYLFDYYDYRQLKDKRQIGLFDERDRNEDAIRSNLDNTRRKK